MVDDGGRKNAPDPLGRLTRQGGKGVRERATAQWRKRAFITLGHSLQTLRNAFETLTYGSTAVSFGLKLMRSKQCACRCYETCAWFVPDVIAPDALK